MALNIAALKKGLQSMQIASGRADNLFQRWILIAEKISEFTVFMNAVGLELSEFLLLKVIMYTMKASPRMTRVIEVNRQYKNFLDNYCQVNNQDQPNRVKDLIMKVSEVSQGNECFNSDIYESSDPHSKLIIRIFH